MKKPALSYIFVLIAVIIGIICGFTKFVWIGSLADIISQIFLRLLKLIAMPIIFLSLISSVSSMGGVNEVKNIGGRILFYTLMTTFISAIVALCLYLSINPVGNTQLLVENSSSINTFGKSYFDFIMQIIPENFFQAFIDNNVMAIAFLGIFIGMVILYLPEENKKSLSHITSSLFLVILQITKVVVFLMPIGIWAFVTIFVKQMSLEPTYLKKLLAYMGCVLGANVIQGFVVLPLILKYKGCSPIKSVKGMLPALLTGFFTKSSNAALPLAIQCAQEKINIRPKIAKITFPLCSVINMNGCAAFILITVFFVCGNYGYVFSFPEMILWIVLSSLAAVGNAGVPMGCFFLASLFLTNMNVSLELMGFILPIYTLLDMVETALNVWSNSCVAVLVNKQEDMKLAKTKKAVVN